MRSALNYYTKLFVWTLRLLPFYLPLSVWIGVNVGYLYIISSWKEVVMLVGLVVLYKSIIELFVLDDRLTRTLNILIAAFVLLHIPYVLTSDDIFTYIAGSLFATRFVVFFLLAQALKLKPNSVVRIVIVTGYVLAVIAIVQTFLPPTLLTSVGYENIGQEIPGLPPAVTTLGEVGDFIRPQATLRGPNPLGAYLVLPICLLIWKILSERRKDLTPYGALMGMLMALALTFSRSAWLACFIGTILVLVFMYRTQLKKVHIAWYVAGAAVFVCMLLAALNNKTFRVVVLREDFSSSVRESDDVRTSLLNKGVADVARHPLGRGPGNAGPTSVLDNDDVGRISENYYLQVAQETGWLGLALFICINALLAVKLWLARHKPYALVALATLIGLGVANMTLHTWSDDAVSIVWWVFAGTVVASIVGTSKQTKKKVTT